MMLLDGRRVFAILALTTGCWFKGGYDDDCSTDSRPTGDPTSPADFDLDGVTDVEIQGSSGSIDFEAGASEGSIAWKTRGGVTVKIEREGARLIVRTERPSLCGGCGVDFTVRVPAGLGAKLSTSDGEIRCSGPVRALMAKTSNAKITCVKLAGRFELVTSNGAIECDEIEPEGESKMKTSNGAVRVGKLVTKRLREVTGKTSNGEICVSLSGFEVTKTKDTFEATSACTEDGELAIETSNGDICVSD